MFPRNDVFDMKILRLHSKIGQVAVFATAACSLPDRFTVGCGHEVGNFKYNRALDCKIDNKPRSCA